MNMLMAGTTTLSRTPNKLRNISALACQVFGITYNRRAMRPGKLVARAMKAKTAPQRMTHVPVILAIRYRCKQKAKGYSPTRYPRSDGSEWDSLYLSSHHLQTILPNQEYWEGVKFASCWKPMTEAYDMQILSSYGLSVVQLKTDSDLRNSIQQQHQA